MFNDSKIKIALFDVDETLLSFNSMIHFIRYFFVEYYGDIVGNMMLIENEVFIKNNKDKLSRELLNEIYYRNFKGVDKSILREIGTKWFNENVLVNDSSFNEIILNKLENHRENGCLITLVSGGFFAFLEPLSTYLNVNSLLCVTVSEKNGVLTGEIEGIQTIGRGKCLAIKSHFKNDVIDWKSSYAYGDHISDLFMLELVGNPVIVGHDQALVKIANEKNWEHIIN